MIVHRTHNGTFITMGIDICSYRSRIGLFGPGRGYKGHRCNDYNPYTAGSDVHFRTFLSGILMIALLGVATGIVNYMTTFVSTIPLVDIPVDCCALRADVGLQLYLARDITSLVCGSYSQRVLMLAMDVEQNPGPLSGSDKDDILNAIRLSSDSLKAEIQCLKNDISKMQGDMHCLWDSCQNVQAHVHQIESNQTRLEAKVVELHHDVNGMKGDRDMLQLDVDSVQENCDRNHDRIGAIEDAVDRIERSQIRANVRVFGLDESNDEPDVNNLKSKVINNVCKVAKHDYDWSPSDIENAYRIGKKGQNARTVVVTFTTSQFKFDLFAGRDSLRRTGIRVSNDLTSREKKMLYDLKHKGQNGYFKNGKLHVRDQTHRHVQKPRPPFNARRRTNVNGRLASGLESPLPSTQDRDTFTGTNASVD